MATFDQLKDQQLDELYKQLNDRAARSTGFTLPGEVVASKNTVTGDKVFIKGVPAQAPVESTADFKKRYPVEDGGLGIVILVRDRDVADGTVWIPMTEHQANFAYGANVDDAVMMSKVIRDWITEASGPTWTVKFFRPDGTRIYGADADAATLDPVSGVVRFKVAPAGATGATEATSPSMHGWTQEGQRLSDIDWEKLSQDPVEEDYFCGIMSIAMTG